MVAHAEITDCVDMLLGNVIELRVPAEVEQLSTVRDLAEQIALRDDFDGDAVADIKMAVDEAGVTLIAHASLGAVLTCRYRVLAEELRVSMTTSSCLDSKPDRRSFGWYVLNALTDAISARVGAIEFVKCKGAAG